MPRIGAWIDRSAMSLSGLCFLHCLLGSVVVAAISTTGSLWLSHNIHAIGLTLAMPLAVVGLWRGIRQHGRWLVAAVGGLGLGFMTGALLAAHGQEAEIFFTMVGVVLLGLAHLFNLRWSA